VGTNSGFNNNQEGGLMKEFTPSSKGLPCPVCGRTKDSDCRVKEQGNLIFCHTHPDDPKQPINGYKFYATSRDGIWGVFISDIRGDKGQLKGRKIRTGETRSQFFYPNRDGSNLLKVEKIKQGGQKQFYQYHWDGTNWVSGVPDKIKPTIPIYRYAEVREAIAANQPIIVVEGETSADALWTIGIAATTFLGGAHKLNSYGRGYKADLSGADLILCPDRDKPGLEHMDEVQKLFPSARLLKVWQKSPIWLCVPDQGGLDVEDWIAEGATKEDILAAIESAPNGKPKKSAVELRKKVEQVDAESDLFQRTLLEQEVGSEYGVRGRNLDRLIDALAPKPESSLVFLSELADAAYLQMEAQAESTTLPGYCTGFHDIDAITQGLMPSDLIVLAARPSMGKTALGLNFALNIAEQYKKPCLVFSLEMSAQQLNYRLISMRSKVSSQRLRTGRISTNEWESVSRAVGELMNVPVGIDDNPSLTVEDIKEKADSVIAQKGDLSLIVIDYLQLMQCNGGAENRNAEISRISRGLKALARQLNVPIIALSQLSRSVESRQDKRPIMSDLRESGAIEQDADMIMMLYREDYYFKDSENKGVTEVSFVKHRNGPTGVVKLLFKADDTSFVDFNPPINIGNWRESA
jgi:replicative DNA helicase